MKEEENEPRSSFLEDLKVRVGVFGQQVLHLLHKALLVTIHDGNDRLYNRLGMK